MSSKSRTALRRTLIYAFVVVQVDYLQQANRDLEQQIKDALDAQHASTSKSKELQEKNDELCGELRKLDKAVKNMESNHEMEASVFRRQIKEIQVVFVYINIVTIDYPHLFNFSSSTSYSRVKFQDDKTLKNKMIYKTTPLDRTFVHSRSFV